MHPATGLACINPKKGYTVQVTMWSDNETDIDFLNFTGVAAAAAEVIHQAQDRPVSLGISGSWGVGKSSMIKLLRAELAKAPAGDKRRYIFVEFNAWLYQGYDDARAALVEAVANKLKDEAQLKTVVDKLKGVLGRIDWLRIARIGAPSALALAFGLTPVGLIGSMANIIGQVAGGKTDTSTVTAAEKLMTDLDTASAGILRPGKDNSPQKEIQAIRSSIEDALMDMNAKLVVLIDDLDRCLPATTIATLEAIRLLLFLKNTAFVIAADEAMIKHAVSKHFDGVDEKLVGSYYDKLVQVPIRVPPLGTQEVRAYLMLLFVEISELADLVKASIHEKVIAQLQQGWQGKRVDRAFMESISTALPLELIARFDLADRLAPLMTTHEGIRGNPRLIKRFLNAMSIRMSLARAQHISVDESALIKLMLFERSASTNLYNELCSRIAHDEEGKPRHLAELEEQVTAEDNVTLEGDWNTPFLKEWLKIPPRLSNLDLRGALYVSRDRTPLMFPEDTLSSEGAEVLALLLQSPSEASLVESKLPKLQQNELSLITSRLLERAEREQEWGTPPILTAILVVAKAAPAQSTKATAFLSSRPHTQIRADIIPLIGDKPWARPILEEWKNAGDISSPVKKAIATRNST